ncbi:MAG: ABC transporter permease [Burkholderiaceae bacterium]
MSRIPVRAASAVLQPLRGVWAYRNFILTSIRAEFKTRLARSRLGVAWFILQPLAQAAIFAIVLSEVMPGRLPGVDNKAAFAIYLIGGLAAWSLFAEIVNRCTTVFVDYAPTLRKIAFPRLCLPLIVGGSALINHCFLLAALVLVCAVLGSPLGLAMAAIPIGIALIALFGFGLGVFLGVLNVFSRDVSHGFAIVMQFWFWFTPIVYAVDVLPERFRFIAEFNPMTPLVAIYQQAVLHDQWPDFSSLLVPAMLAGALLILSFSLFRRASADLVDAL